MKLRLKRFEVSAGRPIIFLNRGDAQKIDIDVGDRINLSFGKKEMIARVDLLDDFLKPGEISVSEDISEYMSLKAGNILEVEVAPNPLSSQYIAKKMDGKELTKEEIRQIIQDIIDNALTEAEIAQFIVSMYNKGMNSKETIYLTDAMYSTGVVLKWKSKLVADKHCIGGIAGNRTTPIVVSICSAAGIIMPKTSSRAITSAAGTADVIETVAKVDFPATELQRIVKKVGACLAWGGSLGLAPADDKLIKIERVLRIDPESQLLASILSKKLSVGSTHVLIDIPFGDGAKVSRQKGERLKKKFIWLGEKFGLKVEVVLTPANGPIGSGIGPALEMRDVIKVLQRDNAPEDLEKKAIMIAGLILEMTKKASHGKGQEMAREILDSGKAWKQFNRIVDAQGRVKNGLVLGKYSKTVKSDKKGKVKHIDNRAINYLASLLGCPVDKGAGIYIHKKVHENVEKGEDLLTFYSQSKDKLDEVLGIYKKKNPVKI